MAARRQGLRALSAVPLLSNGAAGGCGVLARGFMAAAACEGQLTSSSSLLRRSAARHQWQLQQLLGGCRGFAQLPPHIEMQMPSLSPTMERVRPVCMPQSVPVPAHWHPTYPPLNTPASVTVLTWVARAPAPYISTGQHCGVES